MILALVFATLGMQLWNRDLHAPFYYDRDGLLYLPVVKTMIETGSPWHTERLGAPGEQDLHDFPIIDFLHFAALWLIGRVFSDMVLVYNLYGILNYPLTVLTGMWVMRWLGLTLPAAAAGAFLYAFIPYHQERYQYHYFLAAYWWVPVSLVPALAIGKGAFPFFRRGPDGRYPPVSIDWPHVWALARAAVRGSGAAWKSALAWAGRGTRFVLSEAVTRRALGPIAIGVVTAGAGAYYAFFACATYAFAGLYGWVVYRTWRAAAAAALVTAPVIAAGIVYHAPTFVYHSKYGKNPITQRYPQEADVYGLKIAHLLLPANDHNLRMLANLRAKFSGAPSRPSEDETAGSLGFIGGAGLVALLGLTLLPVRRRWPEGAVAALALFLVLLGTIGSFGSIFNLIVIADIRAYNRICVYIAFLCFFIVMWWLDRFLLTRTGQWARKARYPVFAAVLLFGYIDETPWGWNPINPTAMDKVDLFAERFRADKEFFKKIENALPAGAKVFCLPYTGFPETAPVHKMGTYEHLRGYVLTDTLYWSAGAIKGREADAWQRDVVWSKLDELLRRIVVRGFDGLLIDGRGFMTSRDVDRAAAIINRINELYQGVAGPAAGRLPEIVHEDGKQFFLDLRPYRAAYLRLDPAGYARGATEEAEWVAPLWLGGFEIDEHDGDRLVWGPFASQLVLVNPTDRTRKFSMAFSMGPISSGPFEVAIGPPINDMIVLDKSPGPTDTHDRKRTGEEREYFIELPPGRTTIQFRCRAPEHYISVEKRNLCYFIKDFKLKERR